ncbi:MAG: hypothetical protein WC466_10690, partial [Candidatus Izemoplasmatales bacterium]
FHFFAGSLQLSDKAAALILPPPFYPDAVTEHQRFICLLIHFKRRRKYYQGPFLHAEFKLLAQFF